MRKFLILFSLLVLVRVGWAQESTPEPAPEWLASSELHVTTLPDVLNVDSVPTALGDLRMRVDASAEQLLYQYDEGEIQSILLPEAFLEDYRDDAITISPDGIHAVICRIADDPATVVPPTVEFAVDLEQREITQRETCAFGQPIVLQADVWKTTSPDNEYRVSLQSSFPLCYTYETEFALLVETLYTRRVAMCVPDPVHLTRVEFLRWLDDDRLLIKVSSSDYSYSPTEEILILSASQAKVTSLGMEVLLSPEGILFYDDNHRAVQIAVLSQLENGLAEPNECALSLIDFDTEETSNVETTYCLHPPEIHINEQRRELIYLHHEIGGNSAFDAGDDADDLHRPVTTPHIVNLDTYEITELPITGTIVDIWSISPDWNRIAVVIADSDRTRRGTFWPPGAASASDYTDSRFIIYDRALNEVIYEKIPQQPFPETYPPNYAPPFGAGGFEWNADGWRTLFSTEGEAPLFIVSNNGNVQKTRLDRIPYNRETFSTWSPDEAKLLVELDDNSVYVFDTADYTTTPVILPSEQYLEAEWYGSSNQLLVTETSFRESVVRRWLVDLT